ncbi:AraC family transcriptional regulator [Enterovirga rhinocerotis]|uniref:AraC family transcriptional regulator n=1 Tax=Enterovirga rhinocerotis TaxID=1339210 RepID=A0A4R7BIS3_9HYPH|nr:AraC family transcriptional regulator [Enterovirga rhinocerotis]TDR85230.1 AraC family transcriptional regulator [Enterovirga rhinocerotis]
MQQNPDLPENVVSVSALEGEYNGVRIDVTGFHCIGQVSHQFKHTEETRLSVVLEEIGGRCEPRLRPNRPNPIDHMPRHMHFAPAGLEMWGHTDEVRFVRDATLSFDVERLSATLATVFSQDLISAPRLRFADERLWTLVRLLSEAVGNTDPSTQLYCDGLTTAIAARLFSLSPPLREPDSTGLAPWRLRRVIDYLDARLPERVELGQLAELVGLSPSHFSRAFKASTGMAPYQWQLDARIRRAQAQLLDTDASLDAVAQAAGFADAVHFGRAFRKLTGATPAAWRLDRKS